MQLLFNLCVAFWGIFWNGFIFHVFSMSNLLRVPSNVFIWRLFYKLQQFFTLEDWALVPLSKNSIWGHCSEWLYIQYFSACQTAYVHQVSCFYHKFTFRPKIFCTIGPLYTRVLFQILVRISKLTPFFLVCKVFLAFRPIHRFYLGRQRPLN